MKNKVIILSLLMLFFTTVSFAQITQIDGSQIKDSSIAASKIIGGITSGSANTTIEVEAGESLTAGQIVSLISESGTMKAYNNALTVSTSPNGAESVFNAAATTYCSAVALDENRFLVAYKDSDNYPKAIVGTVSGSAISWGSESSPFVTADSTYVTVCKIGTDKILACFFHSSGRPYAEVLSISGTTITTNTPVLDTNFTTSSYFSVTALDTDKALLCFKHDSGSGYGQATVITVSGTTPTFGTSATFNAAATAYISVSALSSTSAIVAYQDGGNSNYGTAQILSISGTTITPGTEYVFESAESNYIAAKKITSTIFAVAYRDVADSNKGTGIVGSVNGTEITYGSVSVFDSSTNLSHITIERISDEKCLVAYTYVDASNSKTIIGNIAGTALTWNTAYSYNVAGSVYNTACYLGSNKTVVAYNDAGNSNYGTAVVNTAFNVDYSSVRGLSTTAVNSGETATVLLSGTASGLSSITQGQQYWLNTDYTMSTAPVSLAIMKNSSTQTGEIFLGVGKSSTEMWFNVDYK